jgi:hypothetical protein
MKELATNKKERFWKDRRLQKSTCQSSRTKISKILCFKEDL